MMKKLNKILTNLVPLNGLNPSETEKRYPEKIDELLNTSEEVIKVCVEKILTNFRSDSQQKEILVFVLSILAKDLISKINSQFPLHRERLKTLNLDSDKLRVFQQIIKELSLDELESLLLSYKNSSSWLTRLFNLLNLISGGILAYYTNRRASKFLKVDITHLTDAEMKEVYFFVGAKI